MGVFDRERRLTKVEERSKSNTHRLDKLEPIVEEIHTMSNTLVELVQEVKHTNETVTSLDAKVDRMDGRVDEMEREPAKDYKRIKSSVAEKVVSGIIGFFMAGLFWAAVQAF